MQKEVPERCFRQFTISEGRNKAHFVTDQLPPHPHLLYLQLKNLLSNKEEQYETEPLDTSEKQPPSCVSKNCGILAPFNKVFYRAQVLGIKRSDDQRLELLVKFVDFGNVGVVDFFQCKELKAKHLYPPQAIACKISNIQQDGAWKEETLLLFRQYLNNFTRNIQIKVFKAVNSNELATIDLIVGDTDIATMLVDSGVSSWTDAPFEPRSNTQRSRIGSCDLVYVSQGWGGIAQIDVSSYRANCERDKSLTYTTNFENESVMNSMQTAYSFCRQFLEERDNNFLDIHTLHFSAENLDFPQYRYYGPSMGGTFALCILSECMKLEIPGDIAITGQISGHGELYTVGYLREKIVGAFNNGKSVIYVPQANILESTELEIEGIEVKPVCDMYQVVEEIWRI